jgi:hypothetical protein
MVGGIETGVQTLYYRLGIVFMFGSAVAAYVKALQIRIVVTIGPVVFDVYVSPFDKAGFP